MKYSVIIPARNEQENLSVTIESVKNQTIQPEKIVVVDDGSTDMTAKIAADCGCQVVTFPETHPNWVARKELAKVFNCGIESLDLSKLDYVMILGADHILSENYVELLSEKMKENNSVVGSGSIENEFAITPRGSGRLIDCRWFESIGGRYPVNYGYESYLVMKSMQMGYEKGYYPEIKSTTQRKTAVTYRPIMYFQYGQAYRSLGYPRHYTVLRSAILIKKGKIISSFYFLCGFVFAKKPRYEKELRDYISDTQGLTWKRLRDKKQMKEYIRRFKNS